MSTLIQTLIYAPEGQLENIEAIMQNIAWLKTAKCDKLIINNSPWLEERIKIWAGKDVTIETYDNISWAKARNKAIAKGYDLTIMADGDMRIENPDWFEKILEAAKVCPAFMVRPADDVIKTITVGGTDFDMRGGWIGQIDVIRRDAIDIVGGYDSESFPGVWGYHDCEYGFRLKKSGIFDKEFEGLLPSLKIDGVIHDQPVEKNPEINKSKVIEKVGPVFIKACEDIESGAKPLYFDYQEKIAIPEIHDYFENKGFINPIQRDSEFKKLIAEVKKINPKTILEIGVFTGGTLFNWIKEFPNAKVVGMDIREKPEFIDCEFIQGDSRDQSTIDKVKELFPDGIDFVFLDSAHTYPVTRAEVDIYLPMTNKIYALHDIMHDPAPLTRVEDIWREIKDAGYKTKEIYVHPDQIGFGIGVIYK